MDYSAIFKEFFDVTFPEVLDRENIQHIYDQEEDQFLTRFRELYPGTKLWRHGYRENSYLFNAAGETVQLVIRMARFKIASGPDKGSTFTFYGSLFIAGSKYSRQFIESSISSSKPENKVKNEVNCRTLTKWRKAGRIHEQWIRSHLEWSHSDGDAGCSLSHLICSCLTEQHSVPFWHLS